MEAAIEGVTVATSVPLDGRKHDSLIYGGASWPLSVTIKNESCAVINLIIIQG